MSDRVLVLGAGGFVGSHLCESLASKGCKVTAATRRSHQFANPRIANAVAPFDDALHFEPLLYDCSAVIHAAASTTPGSTAAHPQLEGNLRCTLALLEAMQRYPQIRLIYLSSGGTIYGDVSSGLASEFDVLRPWSYHGAGKAAAEMFIHAWSRQSDGQAVVLRPSNLYGPGQLPGKGFAIIPSAFLHAIESRPLSVWGNGESIRDFLFVEDFIDLCLRVIASSMAKGVHTYNAASGNIVAISELLNIIDAETGLPLHRDHLPSRSVDVGRVALDNSRAKFDFGWTPTRSLREGISLTWRWFRARA